MLTERFDVVVVGAGPAGAAAAIAARRQGAEVLLLDRADFPRDKPCGDGIAAEAVDVLASIGVHGVTDGYPAIERLRLVAPGGAVVSRALPRAAHTIPRRPAPARGRLLLAGDALSLINPFTGEGIFYAVLSGSLAGAAAAAGPGRVADRYRSALRHRLGRHFRHSGVAAWLTRRPWMVDAAVRAAARDATVFHRMVELGLGDGVFDLRTIGRITARMGHRHPGAP